MKSKVYKIKGSLTIEATLILPIVIVTLLFIANILNICMVHLCMQQALNNTAKKISQNSYLIYRFAGEQKYSDLMNSLNSTIEQYDNVINQTSDLKDNFYEVQNSAKITINATEKLVHTFDGIKMDNVLEYPSKLVTNVNDFIIASNDTIDKSDEFVNAANNLINDDNFKTVFVKLLLDSATGIAGQGISNVLFETYKNELKVPASKIENLNFFNTSVGENGKITFCITYYYKNPFSFINQESLEYSVINNKIKMVNIITLKPFVGKQGSSLKNKLINDNIVINSDNEYVWIPDSAYNVNDGKTYSYHSDPYCSEMNGNVQKVRLSEINKEGSKIKLTGCKKCYKKGLIFEIVDSE